MPGANRFAWHAQNAIFLLLLLAAVATTALLSERHRWRFDWTAGGRNSLSETSQRLVARIDGKISVKSFSRQDGIIRRAVVEMVERYRQRKSDIELEFVDPDRSPDEVRRLGIVSERELVLSYRGRQEHALELTEAALTNALHRLLRAGERWLVYLVGHGERDWSGRARHELGRWGEAVRRSGMTVRPLDLTESPAVPDNTAVLALSHGQIDLEPGELAALIRFVSDGGNLLWLGDPDSPSGLEPLARHLGFRFERGVIVEPSARQPTFITASSYPAHPVTDGFTAPTVYPVAAAIAWESPQGWSTTGIVGTGLRAWAETGDLGAALGFDADTDVVGPFDLGIAMQRGVPGAEHGTREQRIVVIGDGDFLSNR